MAVVVNLEGGRERARTPSLAPLVALVEDDIRRVNDVIIRRMHSPVALIPQLAGHIIAAGGKRMRPMLTLAAAKLCGVTAGDRHVNLAACVEFIHTATLLHDDVVDESDLRRGLKTANAVWGNKASVLVGDFLFSRAFQVMVEDGSLEVLRILSHASAVIAEGEVLQLTTANDTETTEHAYLEVIKAKTATLFAAAARVGAVVANRPKVEEDALESYGLNLGIAFQLVDDVIDYASTAEKMGKRRSASSGAARSRIRSSNPPTSPAPSTSCRVTGRCATRSSAPSITAPWRATRWGSSRTIRSSARSSNWSNSRSIARIERRPRRSVGSTRPSRLQPSRARAITRRRARTPGFAAIRSECSSAW